MRPKSRRPPKRKRNARDEYIDVRSQCVSVRRKLNALGNGLNVPIRLTMALTQRTRSRMRQHLRNHRSSRVGLAFQITQDQKATTPRSARECHDGGSASTAPGLIEQASQEDHYRYRHQYDAQNLGRA